MTLYKEKLHDSATKRIRLSVWKDARGRLVMHLQESTVDASDPQWESFVLFGSWSPTVAREPCARATRAAVDRFVAAHRPEALALVAARVAVLQAEGAAS